MILIVFAQIIAIVYMISIGFLMSDMQTLTIISGMMLAVNLLLMGLTDISIIIERKQNE